MKRVVVTGIGCFNSIARNCAEFADALRAGHCGVRPISIFDTTDYRTNHAAQISDPVYAATLAEHGIPPDTPRIEAIAMVAAAEAFSSAGFAPDVLDPDQAGIAVATSLGGIDSIDLYLQQKHAGGTPAQELYLDNCVSLTGMLAGRYGLNGPSITISTACASGTNSIGCGIDFIKRGEASYVLCGGVDPVSRISENGFNSLKSLSATNSVRSFSVDRDGLIIGEGAAFVILEELGHALARGATIWGEALGYGISNDAYHMTSPDPLGGGACRAMDLCLKDSGLERREVDYINAHGTGTPHNDKMEMNAIQNFFGEHAGRLKVSSIKGMIGHTLGAAGSVEFVATVIMQKLGFIAPTINHNVVMPGTEHIDIIPNKASDMPIRYSISNSYAFAGNTASIALATFDRN